jgi:hypothetical protein
VDAALLALATLLLGAALFGQFKKGGDELLPIGDRIAAGMLAVPILALMVHQVAPTPLSALTPIPLAAYLTMLAIQDRSRLSTVTCVAGLVGYAGLIVGLLR